MLQDLPQRIRACSCGCRLGSARRRAALVVIEIVDYHVLLNGGRCRALCLYAKGDEAADEDVDVEAEALLVCTCG